MDKRGDIVKVFNKMIQKLTDAFSKDKNSNIGKLLLICSVQVDQLNDVFYKIENWRDIDQAQGTTLDAIGENQGQKRGKASDEIMRVLIKARIARNRSDGTINKIIDALARSLDTDPSTIKIKALFDDGEPAALMIEGIPLIALNKVGMSVGQFAYVAQQVVAAGVRIANVDVQGTFAFASEPNTLETSSEFGFAPLDQSSGGRLGTTFNPDEEIILPF